MARAGFMWECSCGYVHYGEDSPEECPNCFSLNNFVKLPEEIVEERERDQAEEILEGKEVQTLKIKSPKKPGRKKK